MRKPCSICAHSSAIDIDGALDRGLSQKDVAAQFQVSRFAVSRHVNKCRAPEPALDSESEIRKWLDRADVMYQSAILNDDARAAISALTAGLRAAEAQSKQAEREAAAPKPEDDARPRIEDIDRLVAELCENAVRRTDALAIEKSKGMRDHLARYDPRETPAQRLETSRAALIYDDLYHLFERCHADADLRSAVLEFASNWRNDHDVSQTNASAN